MQEEPQTGALKLSENTENNEPRTNDVRGLGVSKNITKVEPNWRPFWFAVAILMLAGDQFAKWSAVIHQPKFTYGPFEFSLFKNTGMIFSLPAPSWLYVPVSVAVLAVFTLSLILAIQRKESSAAGLSFIVLGAISNIGDRIIHHATIDYLIFFGRSAINIADVMIVLGVLMLLSHRKTNETEI